MRVLYRVCVCVSCPCIASLYRVRVCVRVSRSSMHPCKRSCIAFVPTFATPHHIRHFLLHVRPLLHIRPILTGWKLLPQHPRASMSLVVSLAMSLVMSLVVSLVVSLVMWGGCDSMNILLERDRRPFWHISHNLSVEMGNFTDKLFILNHLSVRTCLFTDKPVIFGVNPCQDYASLSVSR